MKRHTRYLVVCCLSFFAAVQHSQAEPGLPEPALEAPEEQRIANQAPSPDFTACVMQKRDQMFQCQSLYEVAFHAFIVNCNLVYGEISRPACYFSGIDMLVNNVRPCHEEFSFQIGTCAGQDPPAPGVQIHEFSCGPEEPDPNSFVSVPAATPFPQLEAGDAESPIEQEAGGLQPPLEPQFVSAEAGIQIPFDLKSEQANCMMRSYVALQLCQGKRANQHHNALESCARDYPAPEFEKDLKACRDFHTVRALYAGMSECNREFKISTLVCRVGEQWRIPPDTRLNVLPELSGVRPADLIPQ